MTGYELSRKWFDWCFENPEKIKPNHTALYFFAIEHCNRMGWKKKFGIPTEMTKEAIGIKSYNTYSNTLNDLVEWGFILMIERSKNQYSANIIALSNFDKALDKALDKATVKHVIKQSESTGESIDSIDKPLTKNKEQRTIEFDSFWKTYDKKTGKDKCFKKFLSLNAKDIEAINKVVKQYVASTPDVKFRKNPLTWLNGKHWEDETTQSTKQTLINENGILSAYATAKS